MATVGLSFGSATSGAGFDVATTVTSILAISQAIETPWKTQLTALAAQDTALSGLGTNLASLSTALSSLTDFDGLFASKEGSSSDTNVLTLSSAGTTAVAGSHTIQVQSLATTSSQFSDSLSDAGDTLSGSVQIAVGNASQTITLDSSNNTLATLAAAINNGSYGVTASLVTSSTGTRLSLVSQTAGAAGQISLTPNVTDTTTGAPVGFAQGQAGADAQLTVDGLATTSASNTVTGAIPGVTFQLLSAAPGTSVQVQITNDNSSIETAAQSFVTAYNTIVSAVKTQEGNTSTGAAQPLFGDPTLSLLQSQLSTALYSGSASGSISSLSQLGIETQPDGTLTLSTSTLDSALNAHFSDVTGFFQNSGSFGQSLTTTLDNLGTASPTGSLSLALAQNSTTEAALNKDVTDEEALIATQKTSLTAELNAANQILQSIPSQLNEVNELYSAITGYNQQQQ
jgi:flagellar hook-associated protein 2